jgi:hypothetical protein
VGNIPPAPRTEKFALIVEEGGPLTLGDKVYVLGKADAITFTPATPYQWANIGAGPTQAVIVTVHGLP